MKEAKNSNEAILCRIGARLERLRLDSNIQDAQVIQVGGIKKDAWYNLKSGKNITLINLIKALRGLDALHLLDDLILDNLKGQDNAIFDNHHPPYRKRKVLPKHRAST
jgi:hypothetical protein